jgi:CopG family transcriptional regulator / antitoxin EndoAI
MHQRINITLPEKTIRLIDRVAQNRSRFIDRAVKHYIQEVGRKKLRQQLKEESIQWAEHDLRMAEEWFPLDAATRSRSQPGDSSQHEDAVDRVVLGGDAVCSRSGRVRQRLRWASFSPSVDSRQSFRYRAAPTRALSSGEIVTSVATVPSRLILRTRGRHSFAFPWGFVYSST